MTIRDDNGNYLKAALYFNGKYCVYYFDVSHHLYEYHTENLDDVCEQVNNFFEGQIALDKYEKQLFSIGSGSHFETKTFDYQMNKSLMVLYIALLFIFFFIYGAAVLAFLFIQGFPHIVAVLFLLFGGLCIYSIYFMVKLYAKAKHVSLNISRGNDEFELWQKDILTTYSKNDITQINIYGQTARSSKILNLYELVFADNNNLFIPGALMDPYDFVAKFPACKPNYQGGYFLVSKTFRDYIK